MDSNVGSRAPCSWSTMVSEQLASPRFTFCKGTPSTIAFANLQYSELIGGYMDKANLGLDMSSCKDYLEVQGFVDIEVKQFYLPAGRWPEGSPLS